MKGIIFDIKRFAVHDGPGIRSTLFLKGCPLRCLWCHNPEGLDRAPRLWWFSKKCLACGLCLDSCPRGALASSDGMNDFAVIINVGLCDSCGCCVEACPSGALDFDGREIDAEGAASLLLEDREFYAESGGGVTLSGGDPLAQARFAAAVLEHCGKEGVHRAVETALCCSKEDLDRIMPHTDLFICDLKVADRDRHADFTGVPNDRILENLRYLAASDKDLLVRIPLIPGHTADEKNLNKIGTILSSLGEARGRPLQLELLNYNPLAPNKYQLRNEDAPALEGLSVFSDREMEERRTLMASYGLFIRPEENK